MGGEAYGDRTEYRGHRAVAEWVRRRLPRGHSRGFEDLAWNQFVLDQECRGRRRERSDHDVSRQRQDQLFVGGSLAGATARVPRRYAGPAAFGGFCYFGFWVSRPRADGA